MWNIFSTFVSSYIVLEVLYPMVNYGFTRVASTTPILRVADCEYNTYHIIELVKEAAKENVSFIVFPETTITGYTCGDLFLQRALLEDAIRCLNKICKETENLDIVSIIGLPMEIAGRLYNVGAVIGKGKIWGIVPKTFLPNYNEFYDMRWFSSSSELVTPTIELNGSIVPVGRDLIFKYDDINFALELCEDLWTTIPPSSFHALHGAEVIFNLSASNELVGKYNYRKSLVSQQSARCMAAYVYAAAGGWESTTDTVFSGSSMIAENGAIIAEGKRFSFESQLTIADIDIEKIKNERIKNKSYTLTQYQNNKKDDYQYITLEFQQKEYLNYPDAKLLKPIAALPFVPEKSVLHATCNEIFSIQVGGLGKRLLHTRSKTAVLGISGGLDSTLALLVTARTFDKIGLDRKNIIGITMPGFGTTGRTYNNAIELMKSLGITLKEISIVDAVNLHFRDIEHDPNVHDVTYENSQARERTQILMDYANKTNGMVIGTGDLSELALGWCTYNGDHMSMYAVNCSIPKTLVRTLVKWVAETQMDAKAKEVLADIVDTPVSPELLPADENGNILQITEDTVGPYVLHDFFLYNALRFGYEPKKIYYLAKIAFKDEYIPDIILQWLKVFYSQFFSQQFKRSCMPDGPKVGSINLSPRGDWRMPSDASAQSWLKQLETMQ